MTRTIPDRVPTRTPSAPLRVASVPASHVYVRHLVPVGRDDQVVRLPDPRPADGRTVPGGWWPPVMLDPQWIRRNHHRFDVFHIHFGFDSVETDVLADIVGELRDHDKPLVYTVHDLRNPHQPDPRGHRAQLDVLIPAADELITLTPGAAAEIEKRWGRIPQVLSHPHVVKRGLIEAPRSNEQRFVLGVHAKSLRANMDPLPVLDVLAETIRSLPDAVLRIDLHDELFEPGNHWYDPDTGAALVDFGRRDGVDVRVHEYFTDSQLWQYLSSLTASLLPYRFGTHSGWLEACYDLGTAVIVPSCGYYGQQRPCAVFDFDETHFDAESLGRAVRAVYEGRAGRADWPSRRAERAELAAAHRHIYEQVLAR
ncbi:glycosyltransferase [Nocardia iowensis]|uniref:Glycosyltransferase n=1 Tax=Nocardia iowensis TaxID=204891 RepID=A0ABX8RYW5_NOCIO|nr:glycosyltransferase [Nocardia iowensis]QXN94039.1 glycosyltransferase [Nocardia iowensis]